MCYKFVTEIHAYNSMGSMQFSLLGSVYETLNDLINGLEDDIELAILSGDDLKDFNCEIIVMVMEDVHRPRAFKPTQFFNLIKINDNTVSVYSKGFKKLFESVGNEYAEHVESIIKRTIFGWKLDSKFSNMTFINL